MPPHSEAAPAFCCVLTRSAGSHAVLRQQLQQLLPRMPIFDAPLLNFVASDPTTALAELARCTEGDWLIFVSPRAVEFTAALWPIDHWPAVRIACIGQATASALKRRHPAAKPVVPDTTEDSEGLLAALDPADFLHARVWLLRGQDGRERLPEQLRDWGATVTPVAVYQRQCRHPEHWPTAKALWVITAPAALGCFAQSIGQRDEAERARLLNSPLVLINRRAEVLARDLGFTGAITLSEAPDDDALAHACARAAMPFTTNQESAS